MKPQSLLRRVFIRLAIVSAATIAAALGLLYWQMQHTAGGGTETAVARILEEVAPHIRVNGDGKPYASLPRDFPVDFHEERFVVVANGDGDAFFSIPPGTAHVYHPFSSERTDRPQYFEHRYSDSENTYLGVTHHIARNGVDLWVQVVEEVPYWKTPAYHSIEHLAEGIAVLAVLHLLAAAALSYQAVRATLIPVRRAAAEARQIGPGSGGARIGTGELPEEVLPLADAANGALDRLQDALAAQKRFTADAAHELLTPLAVIRAEAESLEDRERARALLSGIHEMSDMATQLLELAELDGMATLPDEACDLRAIAEDVLARFAAQAIKHGIEPHLTVAEDPVAIRGSARALGSALGNLVRNAIQHADGATSIEIRIEGPARISVIDDGPGVPPEARERIFERFHRSASGDHGNRGLGLAIARQIVENHGGTISVAAAPGGRGASFTMEFPAPPARAGSGPNEPEQTAG